MDWFFDGFGTMLVGFVLGGGLGSVVTHKWHVRSSSTTQTQTAGNNATQMQAGRDQTNKRG